MLNQKSGPTAATALDARSPLGSPRDSTGAVIVATPQIHIQEMPWVQIHSLRCSRKQPKDAGLSAIFGAAGLQAPSSPNGLQGGPQLGCSWLEPHAWLVLSASSVAIPAQPGWLVTDLSDRFAVFSIKGSLARQVIAAGCDAHMVRPGAMARTRFAGMANVVIEQWADDEYRLLLDVSVAGTFAAWLRSTAKHLEQQ